MDYLNIVIGFWLLLDACAVDQAFFVEILCISLTDIALNSFWEGLVMSFLWIVLSLSFDGWRLDWLIYICFVIRSLNLILPSVVAGYASFSSFIWNYRGISHLFETFISLHIHLHICGHLSIWWTQRSYLPFIAIVQGAVFVKSIVLCNLDLIIVVGFLKFSFMGLIASFYDFWRNRGHLSLHAELELVIVLKLKGTRLHRFKIEIFLIIKILPPWILLRRTVSLYTRYIWEKRRWLALPYHLIV